jgi:ferritin-like metal-binding protein YciE
MTGTLNADTREIYITGVRNAHALGSEAESLINRQLERLTNYPDLAQRMRTHLDETRIQKDRLDEILSNLQATPSAVKEGVMSMMGNLAAAAHMPADDVILKNTFANHAFENYEIAAYKSLIAMAEQGGQTNHIGLLQQSLQEEERMAQFLSEKVGEITRRFLSLRSSGQKADR